MSLCNVQAMHVFWSPALRRIYTRSTMRSIADCYRSGRGRPALPADAVHVGTYLHGDVGARQIMEDLETLLRAPAIERSPEPVAEAHPTSIAAPKEIPECRWAWAPANAFMRRRTA